MGGEDPLEEGRQPTPVFLPGEFPWPEEPGGLQSLGVTESDTTEGLSTSTVYTLDLSEFFIHSLLLPCRRLVVLFVCLVVFFLYP